ncbi:MAG: glycosyltransferase family 9 protein [Candidatus Omnitrophica bacterium]|nr:glycosyltransferase family 9 protein [Candidatus Omnitrophota bacterium]
MPKSNRISLYKSFLVINPFGIGDVLFSTPLLSNLKKAFPQSDIYYLCNSRAVRILKNNPAISGFFIYDRDEFERVRKMSTRIWLKKTFSFLKNIKKKRIEVALDLSLNSQFGFFSWVIGIPRRIGLNYKGRGRFLTDKIPFSGFCDRHVAEYYLDVLRALPVETETFPFAVFTSSGVSGWAKEFIEQNQLTGKPIIGLVPCGGEAFGKDAKIRRWDKEKFAGLAVQLIDRFDAEIFLFAGPKEKREVDHIINMTGSYKDRCHDLSEISLEEMIALMRHCSLCIGNNTGPLRFADALDKPIIALAGPVDERVYGSYPASAGRVKVISKQLSCQPCYRNFRIIPCEHDHQCLEQISVDEVLAAAQEVISRQGDL